MLVQGNPSHHDLLDGYPRGQRIVVGYVLLTELHMRQCLLHQMWVVDKEGFHGCYGRIQQL